jgi:hypothetical protein
VKTPARVLICYDFPEDDTLPVIRAKRQAYPDLPIELVHNPGRGVHAAVLAGYAASNAPFDLAFPADDDFNAGILDAMVADARAGCDIVCASRFMPVGRMESCPWLKAVLARSAAFILDPACPPTTRPAAFGCSLAVSLISRTDRGFCYSLEPLVKAHRLGWRVAEVPAVWFKRKHGSSRFKVLGWVPVYLRWFGYAFATTLLHRTLDTVAMKPPRA